MQLKSILLAALMGMTAIEASAIPNDSKSLVARQQRGGGRGGNGGNNANAGNNNAGNNAAASSTAADTAQATNAANGNNNNNNGGNNNNNNNNNNAASTCLEANAIQTGSASDGQNGAAEAGQVASATDNANFINFCAGKTLTNGLQVQGGSCNGIPMGEMPASSKMVSTVMLNPAHNDNIAANTDFDVTLKIANLQAGFFTNPQATYYSAPQALNGQGIVIGHTHVVIQDLGNSLNPQNPLDATQFAFFKGINDNGNGQGTLSATVTGGLPAGNYRVCTMSGASNHQPVLMPVAQRGTQEDCNKFTVTAGGGGNNNNNGNANNGNANNGNANNGNSGSNNNNNNQNNNNNNNQNNGNNGNTNNSGGNNTNTNAGAATGGTGGASAANALGGIAAPAVTNSGDSSRPFSVNGNTFVNKAAAVQRACSIQNNACADAVNGGKLSGVTVGECGTQESACIAELS